MAPAKRRWLRRLGIGLGIVLLGGGAALWWLDAPRPVGVPGPPADALARRMGDAVDLDAWERTGAVRFSFGGRNEHLWDRTRRLHRVRWGDIEVLRSFDTGRGRAYEGGQEVLGPRLQELLDSAYARWANDAFWLNPVAKLFDEGVSRGLVPLEGGAQGLLVSYASGGVTPGDAYLWTVDEAGLPTQWRMWVRILPVGGIRASWERWQTLSTGARVSTLHRMAGRTLEVAPVEAAATLAQLVPGADPFAAIVAK